MLRDPSPEVRETAMQEIRKYGRFSEPILKRILEQERDVAVRERIRKLIAARDERTEIDKGKSAVR
jgi:hypothetical protein